MKLSEEALEKAYKEVSSLRDKWHKDGGSRQHLYDDNVQLAQAAITTYLEHALDDPVCILEKGKNDTVICGWGIAEQYLRRGYTFNWEATDESRNQGNTSY